MRKLLRSMRAFLRRAATHGASLIDGHLPLSPVLTAAEYLSRSPRLARRRACAYRATVDQGRTSFRAAAAVMADVMRTSFGRRHLPQANVSSSRNQHPGKRTLMRYKPKSIAALQLALGGLPDRMRVEVDPDIE